MIYDVFLFHGELDLLELRLNILDKVVDKFVICECPQNFSGTSCPLYYQENKERFKKWEDKIIYYTFNLMEDKDLVEQARNSPNTERGNPYWMKVYYAMETMRKPLEGCKDEDIILISDCDEIWNPNIEIDLLNLNDTILGYKQKVYYYQLNNRCSEEWTGTVCLYYKLLKNIAINEIKQKGDIKLENGGWHFTYQGGEEAVRLKVNSARDGTNRDSYYGVPTEDIVARMKENKDIFPDYFRPTHKFWTDESDWPQYLKDNRHLYLNMLK